MGLISRVSSRTYRESHFFFCKMAMIRTSALRFAIRTSAIRQNPDIKNPFDLNRTGEFHDKYKAEHGEKFRYAYVDCGPSIAPWMNLPTESKPNPFGDHNDLRNVPTTERRFFELLWLSFQPPATGPISRRSSLRKHHLSFGFGLFRQNGCHW